MSFEQFKEFFDKHPDLDNTEYYAEFPETNKSTIRSWKSRLTTPPEPPKPPTPTVPTKEKDDSFKKEYAKLLMKETGARETEFEGVDLDTTIIILRNRQKDQQVMAQQTGSERTSNTSILPVPKPIGQSNKQFGIDEYIVFDGGQQINAEPGIGIGGRYHIGPHTGRPVLPQAFYHQQVDPLVTSVIGVGGIFIGVLGPRVHLIEIQIKLPVMGDLNSR